MNLREGNFTFQSFLWTLGKPLKFDAVVSHKHHYYEYWYSRCNWSLQDSATREDEMACAYKLGLELIHIK